MASDRSQDNTSDKETHTPMLKVFKDMMKRETNWDPEKVSLIYPHKEEKKRRKHSKGKHSEDRRFDAKNLDQSKSQMLYNMNPTEDEQTDKPERKYSLPNTQCYGSSSEKDSKSGMSCALQKLVSIEHSGIACLMVLVFISVAVACTVIYGTVPTIAGKSYFGKAKTDQNADKKLSKDTELEKIKNHLDQSKPGDELVHSMKSYRNEWPSAQRSLASDAQLSDEDETEYVARRAADSSLKDDLQNVKNFYQKLMATDEQIKDLKKRIDEFHTDNDNNMARNRKDALNRYKRSMIRDYLRAINAHDKRNIEYVPKLTEPEETQRETRHKPLEKSTKKPTRFVLERQHYLINFDNLYKNGDKLKLACNCSHSSQKDEKEEEKHLTQHYKENERAMKNIISHIPSVSEDPLQYISYRFQNQKLNKKQDKYVERPFRHGNINLIKHFKPAELNGSENSFTLTVGNRSLVYDDKEYMKDLLVSENTNDIEEKLKAFNIGKKKNKILYTLEDITDEVSSMLKNEKKQNKRDTPTPVRPNGRKLLQTNEVPEIGYKATEQESPSDNIYSKSKSVHNSQDSQDVMQLKTNLNFANSAELNRMIKNAVLQNILIGLHDVMIEKVELDRLDRDLNEVEKLEQQMKEKTLDLSDLKPMKNEPESPDVTKTNTRKLLQVVEDRESSNVELESKEKITSDEMNSGPNFSDNDSGISSVTENSKQENKGNDEPNVDRKTLDDTPESNIDFETKSSLSKPEVEVKAVPRSVKINELSYSSTMKPGELTRMIQNAALTNWFKNFEESRQDLNLISSEIDDRYKQEQQLTEFVTETFTEMNQKKAESPNIRNPYSRKLLQSQKDEENERNYSDENNLTYNMDSDSKILFVVPENDKMKVELQNVMMGSKEMSWIIKNAIQNLFKYGKEENILNSETNGEKIESLRDPSLLESVNEEELMVAKLTTEMLPKMTTITISESPDLIKSKLRRLLESPEDTNEDSEEKASIGEIINMEGEQKLPYGSQRANELKTDSEIANLKIGVPIDSEEFLRMINNAVLKNWFTNTHGSISPSKAIEKAKNSLDDFDYKEDINDLNEKLIKVSQAYSDYGVLEEKRGDVVEHAHDESKSISSDPESIKEIQILNQQLPTNNTLKPEQNLKELQTFNKLQAKKELGDVNENKKKQESQEIKQLENIQKPQSYNQPQMKLDAKHGRNKKTLLFRRFPGFRLGVQPEENVHKSSFKKTIRKFINFAPDNEFITEAVFKKNGNEITTDTSLFNGSPDFGLDESSYNFQLMEKETTEGTTKRAVFDAPKIDIDIRLPSSNRRNLLSINELLKDDYTKTDNVSDDSKLHLNETKTKVNATESVFKDDIFEMLSDIMTFLFQWYDSIFEIKYTSTNDTYFLNKKFNETKVTPKKNSSEDVIPIIKSRTLLSVNEAKDKSLEIKDLGATTENNLAAKVEPESFTQIYNQTVHLEKENNGTLSGNEMINSKTNESNFKTYNKTVVKRDVPIDENNIIFWNDIYDDEYGIDLPKRDILLKDDNVKSENWLSKKIHGFKDHYGHNKTHWSSKNNGPVIIKKRMSKQRSAPIENNKPNAQKENFEKLSANMEKVFKQAADVISELRAPEVSIREPKDVQNEETSTMMQQLVTLMSDLVNYQVQQKTCVKLPPDLREFLVWLTQPGTSKPKNNFITLQIRDPGSSEHDVYSSSKPSEPIGRPNSERDHSEDPRSDCLGTLRAVQDLLEEYDRMSDNEKTKLSGVREYLEVQLDYLQRQLTGFNGGGFTKAKRLRKKELSKHRTHPEHKTNYVPDEISRNNFENLRKEVKYFQKKTANDLQTNDESNIQNESKTTRESDVEMQREIEDFRREKRNIAKIKEKLRNFRKKHFKVRKDLKSPPEKKLNKKHANETIKDVAVQRREDNTTKNITEAKIDVLQEKDREMKQKEIKKSTVLINEV